MGVVLITLGLVFLVAQFVPGLLWWQMWPLIIVLLGGIQIVTPDPKDGWGLLRILDGVGTVLFGLVLLGCTTGFISWGIWLTLLSLWPVLLIALGIAIVGRALGQSWIRALSPLVIWVALGYAVALSLTGQGGYRPMAPVFYQSQAQTFDLRESVGYARRANVSFEGGAGDIRIGSTSGSDVRATGTSQFGAPRLTVNRSDESADVVLGVGGGHTDFIAGDFGAGRVDVGLPESVLWDVTLNTGGSNLVADLTSTRLSALTLKTGASSVDMKLGRVASEESTVGIVPIVVKAGVSSIIIRVPRGVAARVEPHNGLSSMNVASEFERAADNSYQTSGYASARTGYDIQVESGIAGVSILTY